MKHTFSLQSFHLGTEPPLRFSWDQIDGTFSGPDGDRVAAWCKEAKRKGVAYHPIGNCTLDVPIKDPFHDPIDLGQVITGESYDVVAPLGTHDVEAVHGPWPEYPINPETGEEDRSLGLILY